MVLMKVSILGADITDYFNYGFNESLSILGADITDYFNYGFNESLSILGADITDYFNYGFNEETWRMYCERQRRMRNDSTGSSGRIYVRKMQPEIIFHYVVL
jgi:predicted aldo/keto reductase-like oxidoreductase